MVKRISHIDPGNSKLHRNLQNGKIRDLKHIDIYTGCEINI